MYLNLKRIFLKVSQYSCFQFFSVFSVFKIQERQRSYTFIYNNNCSEHDKLSNRLTCVHGRKTEI